MGKKRKAKPFWDKGVNPIVGYRLKSLDNMSSNRIAITKPDWGCMK